MQHQSGDFTGNELSALVEAACLTARLKDGSITDTERQLLEEWLALDALHRQWFNYWQENRQPDDWQQSWDAWEKEAPAAFAAFRDKHIQPAVSPARVYFLRSRVWVAASIVLAIITGIFLFTNRNANTKAKVVKVPATEIEAGKNGAVLTLADGSQVVLDSLSNGTVALQNGSQAAIKNGELIYTATGNTSDEAVYNTIRTPNGRQFSLLLPDGSRVWLNAASTIRYPTTFPGKERRVELSGEAYFEVAKNSRQPFRVQIKKTEIEVVGTHFNVNAYDNEQNIYTTLLEGSVKVNTTLIKPGQQALVNNNKDVASMAGGVQIVNDIEIDKVMAWHYGLFNFKEVSLAEIMRQLERWYDIEVVYEKNIPDIALSGEITRDVTLKSLLAALQRMGLHCRLEARTLIILP